MYLVGTEKLCKHGFHLHQGEVHPDTHVTAFSERHEGERIDRGGGRPDKKTPWQEAVRVIEKRRIAVAGLLRHKNVTVRGDAVPVGVERTDIPTRQ